MKNLHKLLFVLLLLFSFNSCENEDIKVSSMDNQILQSNTSAAKETPQTSISEEEALENTMQWVSYMIAQMLTKEVSGTQRFVEEYNAGMINNEYSIIKLTDLLINNQENQSFINSFEREFNIFTGVTNNPCESQGRPHGRLNPPPCVPIPCGVSNDPFEFLIGYLTIGHCLELYVSNNFDFSLNIISSAHPMISNATTNVAFEHSEDDECDVIETLVGDDGRILHTINLIVARPYRDVNSCAYSQFAEISDFSLFPF